MSKSRFLKGGFTVSHLVFRNAATETVQQELKFVGQESGKLLAIRELLRKVSFYSVLRLEEPCVHQKMFIIRYFTSIQTPKLMFYDF